MKEEIVSMSSSRTSDVILSCMRVHSPYPYVVLKCNNRGDFGRIILGRERLSRLHSSSGRNSNREPLDLITSIQNEHFDEENVEQTDSSRAPRASVRLCRPRTCVC